MTRLVITGAAGALAGAVLGFFAAGGFHTAHATPPSALSTEYQLVLLDNGQAYFGKLENFDSPNPILRDVFYIQTQADPETKQTKSSLVKRGKEWHEPDSMMLAGQHIVLVEPVSPTSTVAKLIHEYKR